MATFAHLRAHSQYSLSDGLLLVSKDKAHPEKKPLPALAAKDGQGAIALTDLHGLFGSIGFYTQARALGVKPILGADVWIDPDVTQGEDVPPVRINLLCETDAGYKRLLHLVSQSNTENHRNDLPRIKQSWLRENSEGLIALSGDGTHGELAGLFHAGMGDEERAKADAVVDFYANAFPGRYFMEVQRYAQPNETIQVAETVALAGRKGIPLVATHPIQFEKREDYYAHEVRTCIAGKGLVDDPLRDSPFTREQHFKTTAEMQELFADLPEAIENTGRVAELCSSSIRLGEAHLPRFPTTDGSTEGDYFARLSREGLERRLKTDFPDEAERERVRPEYEARLEREIGVINKMGFAGYFLIVADFIGWAKDNGIPVGPGRGSGAGSLVAHSLRITNLDPLPHGLLFERFLNPDRVSMPDFDIDIDIFRRGEVVDYVRQKYGQDAVSQICTIGTSAAKMSVRNVARALGLPYIVGDVVSKLVPAELDITLSKALEKEPRLKDRYESEPLIRKVVDVAMMLEGSVVSVGKHAAGVLIAPGRISDFSPLHLGSEGVVSQYDKDDVEAAGLVKFDFLGLANLSIVQQAQDMINRRPEFQDKPFDIETLTLDDERVYKLFANGDTVGIFQFESGGMQGTLRQAQPTRFADLVALNALFRPGPMDLIPTFVERRHGRMEVEYPDPRVKDVLEETYGIMVYQEQVMKVAQILGGYSLGGADLLRRAMGKKKPEEMAAHRQMFAEGAAKNGISKDQAEDLFDLIETFAGYGFNKSHAAAYSLIAYQTAYLKLHFPSEFYAASMNVAAKQSKQAEIEKLLGDARSRGLKILPPDINEGGSYFEPVGKNALRYGLSGLKGVSEGPVEAIVQARSEQGKFTSLFDFFSKVPRGMAGKTVADSLIRAGAFDSLHGERARSSLLASVPDGVKYGSKLAKQEAEKGSLLPDDAFGPAPTKAKKKKKPVEIVEPALAEATPWSPREQLDQEKKAVGFYFSAHPFDLYAKQLQGIAGAVPLSRIDEIAPEAPSTYLVAGIVAEVKKFTARSGHAMAHLRISDGTETRDLTMFPSLFQTHGPSVKVGSFLAVEAKVQYDKRGEELPKSLLMEDMWTFEAFEAYQARAVHLAMKRSELPRLQALAEKHGEVQGGQPLKTTVYVPEDEENYHRIDLHALKVSATPEFIADLKDTFGFDNVKLAFAREITFRPKEPRYAKGNKNRRPGP